MGRSPWAATLVNDAARITEVAAAFNTALLLAITDLGSNVLYVDATYYYNLLLNAPSSYSLTNSTTVVCTSTDSANSIGIGAGNTSSARCTPSTIGAGLAYDSYLFADPVYFTPAANRLFGNYAYDRLRLRF
jgi:phospholipase/lecithinase/hemolysin